MPPLPAWRAHATDEGGIYDHLSDLLRRTLPSLLHSAADDAVSSHIQSRSAASESISSRWSSTPRHVVLPRQQQSAVIPAYYSDLNNSPQPGTVAGIILGSVAGFLFILWLIYLCFNMGNRNVVVEQEVVERPRRSSRASRRETVEISRSRSPRRSPARQERIVVEERRERTPTVVERDDDIVEVIEEHSPVRHSHSNRRPSGFRTVDPDRYGGGNAPLEEVYRKTSRRSRR